MALFDCLQENARTNKYKYADKEGAGCSDEQLYENIEFNSENHVNLFEECFKKLTTKQVKIYEVSGKTICMDSQLISSNIAWYSHYEIILSTLIKIMTREDIERIDDQMTRQRLTEFLAEDAEKTVYRTESVAMGKRLLDLGIAIYKLLQTCGETEMTLLRKVFGDQYKVDGNGNVTPRDKAKISPTSVQNPNDPDAAYRSAVEAQATDREYRIGQHKNVLVTRFVTEGTFEERIDKMLQEKRYLTEMTVASGEKWIGKFSNQELRELVVLENK